MEEVRLNITQTIQPTLAVEIVQNSAPVMTAEIVIGGGGSAAIVFGTTLTGAGTQSDPINVSEEILQEINNTSERSLENAGEITSIKDLIPATATADNQLADQGFVNSSIQTATAYFRGDWATWADAPSDPALYPADATGNHTPITNDYMVVIADEKTNGGTWRYKYTGVWAEQGKDGWLEEYQVNETPLTAAQLAALNSGVTAQAVADIATNKNNITGLQNGKQDKLVAGNGITIDGNTISASGSGASGDYLPLSGGTLTGAIEFEWSGNYLATPNTILKTKYNRLDTDTVVEKDVLTVNPNGEATFNAVTYFYEPRPKVADGATNLGTTRYCFGKTFTKKINAGYENGVNSGDLIVPTQAGTLARLEDIDLVVGDISAALDAINGEAI